MYKSFILYWAVQTSLKANFLNFRFAQRVALIKNEALVNEELDPRAMIARLKQQVSELKQDLVLVSGDERTEELTGEEIGDCRKVVEIYLEETDPETHIQVRTVEWVHGGDVE